MNSQEIAVTTLTKFSLSCSVTSENKYQKSKNKDLFTLNFKEYKKSFFCSIFRYERRYGHTPAHLLDSHMSDMSTVWYSNKWRRDKNMLGWYTYTLYKGPRFLIVISILGHNRTDCLAIKPSSFIEKKTKNVLLPLQ